MLDKKYNWSFKVYNYKSLSYWKHIFTSKWILKAYCYSLPSPSSWQPSCQPHTPKTGSWAVTDKRTSIWAPSCPRLLSQHSKECTSSECSTPPKTSTRTNTTTSTSPRTTASPRDRGWWCLCRPVLWRYWLRSVVSCWLRTSWLSYTWLIRKCMGLMRRRCSICCSWPGIWGFRWYRGTSIMLGWSRWVRLNHFVL